ncbi:hypothetical protein [Owenweeksia hongkongensis]|uniref:hypothetical protein n=1 Tax=Owenweeksia hongkongensis TaxID=253245 RepID=UPI003A94BEFD
MLLSLYHGGFGLEKNSDTSDKSTLPFTFIQMKNEITIKQLQTAFDRIIAKLELELGEEGHIELKTSAYRLIPTEEWSDFSKPENWYSSSKIEQGDLVDDLKELKKLIKDSTQPCTYVDFDRVASILREISQVQNPIS